MGHPQVTKIYKEEKLYSVRSLVTVHIVSFQRDLFVMRFIHIELIICSTSKVSLLYYHTSHYFTSREIIRNDCRDFNNLPPRSSYATPCDFFIWGYVEDQVYVPPLPASIPELKVRIGTATETITAEMLQTVWNELDYRVDVCRITTGAHIRYVTKTWSVVL